MRIERFHGISRSNSPVVNLPVGSGELFDMHELSFASQILESIEHEAAKYPGSKVVRVKLVVGEMLALEPASLRFCLESIIPGTVMDGAEVEIEETGPELDCPSCGRVGIESPLCPVCPECGGIGQVVVNPELIIKEIELDEQDCPT